MTATSNQTARAKSCLCPVCGDGDPVDLLEISGVPVYCNMLWFRQADALHAPQGSMSLKYCAGCGHAFNAAFDAGLLEYTPLYDTSLHYSTSFNRYAHELAQRLVSRYGLHGRKVVEIGCGKGNFLILLCELGDNHGWGFDRSFDPERVGPLCRQRISFVQDFYTSARAAQLRPDFVCFRHVLEHIAAPLEFLRELRRGFGDRTDATLYCEVPNALFTLKDLGIWDLIYEHCAYFTLGSLTEAVLGSGFDVLDMGEAFGGQYLYVEMRPGMGQAVAAVPEEHCITAVRPYADSFADYYRNKVEAWRERLAEMRQAGRRVVIWGAGSKGVTFLNVLGAKSEIDYVVDLNPHKHGKFVAGTGQMVVSPESLRALAPTDIIVMNPIYEPEIAQSVRALGLDARVHCV